MSKNFFVRLIYFFPITHLCVIFLVFFLSVFSCTASTLHVKASSSASANFPVSSSEILIRRKWTIEVVGFTRKMLSNFPVTNLKLKGGGPSYSILRGGCFCRFGYYCRSSGEDKFKLKVLVQSLGDKLKLNDIDTNAIQERLNSWLSKTQHIFKEVVASPLVKDNESKVPYPEDTLNSQEMEESLLSEVSIHRSTPEGVLSLASIVSIEQFGRMNGLTGKKMQKIFNALVPPLVSKDARNLVEYCCFKFLSRHSSGVHPSLKEPAFQRLIFITMLAWGNPYQGKSSSRSDDADKASLQGKLVQEDAFVRIAPAIPGLADRCTAHSLFKSLSVDEKGISIKSWLIYVDELLKVHEARNSFQMREFPELMNEKILCIASSRKQPVLKWNNNMAWPGKLVLTDRALYFEAAGLQQQKEVKRFDLTKAGLQVTKSKVGPLGSDLFDSAVSISSGPGSETWVLEFVNLGGDFRRDVWHGFINEVIALHNFIREFGPDDSDQSISLVYGADKGKERATTSAICSIARLQALQFMQKLLDDPIKLVQFSYLQNAPDGDIVCQTLAVNYWGGPLTTKFADMKVNPSDEVVENTSNHVYDIDGSIYLQKWMKSPSWVSTASINFWKNTSVGQGLVLNKNLVVADVTLVERAAKTSRKKLHVVENTQATIDAATLKGIPSNIDLFKELVFPLTRIAKSFLKLRRWEEPHLTISFLAISYTIIFRNLLPYVLPAALMILAAVMLILKRLKDQGRLGRSFGKVTIRDQPPSNTIQKIIAVRDAMNDVESYLQNLNVTLLKIRTIVLSGQPQVTTEVAFVLLSSAATLLVIPFKYILVFVLVDLFTRELNFRKKMINRFHKFLKERWNIVPAAPVVVLPFEDDESKPTTQVRENVGKESREKL